MEDRQDDNVEIQPFNNENDIDEDFAYAIRLHEELNEVEDEDEDEDEDAYEDEDEDEDEDELPPANESSSHKEIFEDCMLSIGWGLCCVMITCIIFVGVIVLLVFLLSDSDCDSDSDSDPNCDSGSDYGPSYTSFEFVGYANQTCGYQLNESKTWTVTSRQQCTSACYHNDTWIDTVFYITYNYINTEEAYSKCFCYDEDSDDRDECYYDICRCYEYRVSDFDCPDTTGPDFIEVYSEHRPRTICNDGTVDGRPYFTNILLNNNQLKANLKLIDCTYYEYLYTNDSDVLIIIDDDINIEYKTIEKWLEIGLAEYSSIATFARFSLELMSHGAPLWLVELSNKAQLDEIKHTKIVFEIANKLLEHINNTNKSCIVPDKFPNHEMNINNDDWNKMVMDVIIGGCFGETVSALTMMKRHKIDNIKIIDKYLYEISLDEINHSSFAWIVIRWIIDQLTISDEFVHSNILHNISNKKWWYNQLNLYHDKDEYYIYKAVIPSIIEKVIFMNDDKDSKQVYDEIVEELQHHLNVINNNFF